MIYAKNEEGNVSQVNSVKVIIDNTKKQNVFTPEACMDAFFTYSAKKRKNYDINDTDYVDPSG